MAYRLAFTRSAQRDLKRLPAVIQNKINSAVEGLQENPRPHGAKKLKNSTDTYRIRIGDYRVAYTVKDDVLIVIVIGLGHRKDIYEKLNPE